MLSLWALVSLGWVVSYLNYPYARTDLNHGAFIKEIKDPSPAMVTDGFVLLLHREQPTTSAVPEATAEATRPRALVGATSRWWGGRSDVAIKVEHIGTNYGRRSYPRAWRTELTTVPATVVPIWPVWLLTTVLLCIGSPVLRRRVAEWRRARRTAAGRCPACAYDLTANASGVCPECGAPAPGAKPRPRRIGEWNHLDG